MGSRDFSDLTEQPFTDWATVGAPNDARTFQRIDAAAAWVEAGANGRFGPTSSIHTGETSPDLGGSAGDSDSGGSGGTILEEPGP